MTPVAVIDACVLFPPALRDFLMCLADVKIFQPRWTETIHEEWIAAVLANRSHIGRASLERCRRFMDGAVRGSLVAGHDELIETLSLPDPDDRHVLAAAIHSGAEYVVTFNLRDFPVGALAPHGIEAIHPDQFVDRLLDDSTDAVIEAARRQRASLKNPAKTVEEYLDSLAAVGLPNTAARLRLVADRL